RDRAWAVRYAASLAGCSRLPTRTQVRAERVDVARHGLPDDDRAVSGVSARQVWGTVPIAGWDHGRSACSPRSWLVGWAKASRRNARGPSRQSVQFPILAVQILQIRPDRH